MSTVEKNDLAVAIKTVAEELAKGPDNQASTPFQVLVEGAPRELHPILRDEVYRLATEALRNAFRHAPAVVLLVEQAKHVGDEENQQYCPKPYAGPAARTPAGMAIVPSTEAKNQYQDDDDDEYQHCRSSFLGIYAETDPA